MPAIAAAIGVVGTVIATRGQSSAQQRALNAQRDASQMAMDVEERRIISDREYRDQQERDAKARADADDEMAAKMWGAQEEERLWRRQIEEEERAYTLAERKRRDDERIAQETARANYVPVDYGPSAIDPRVAARRTLQQNAATTLGGLLNTGTPGYRPATAPIPQPMPGQPINPFIPNPLVRR